jgi:hypothetical protein
MQLEQTLPHMLVRRYKGKHALEHFHRHAAYMAKRGWTVVGTPERQGQALIVTFRRCPPPNLALGANVGIDPSS